MWLSGSIEDGYFDAKELANLEDDFTAEAQQAIFMREDQLLNFALQDVSNSRRLKPAFS
jgi:hypothetical protein